MPDWQVLFGEAPAWQVFLWIAAVGVMVTIVVKLWPFIRNAVAIVDALLTLPEMSRQVARLVELPEQVSEIHHETQRNDGTSIKDAVDRLEVIAAETGQSVEGLHGRLDDVDRQLNSLAREDEALWAELESTQNPNEEEP